MNNKTINVKFDKSALPRWAQHSEIITLAAMQSLAFRIQVHAAKTPADKRMCLREAQRLVK